MVARVFINAKKVGSIELELYEKIKKRAYADITNYFKQFFITLKFLTSVVVMSIKLIPLFWFMCFFFCILFAPEQMTTIITTFRESSPESLTETFRLMMIIGLLAGFSLTAMQLVTLSTSIRYKNAFQESVEKKVMELLEIRPSGEIYIHVDK